MTEQAHKGSRLRNSLEFKATAFITLVVLTVGATLSWYFLRESEKVLREELQRRALSLTTNLAHNSRYGIITEDEVILRGLVDGILKEDNVIYLVIADSEGKILAEHFKEDLQDATSESPRLARALAAAVAPLVKIPSVEYHGEGSQAICPASGIYHASAPVTAETVASDRER